MSTTSSQSNPTIKLNTASSDCSCGLNICLFNLVVFSGQKSRSEYYHNLVRSVVEHFPSRVLFVDIETDGEVSQVTTECASSAQRKGPSLTGNEEYVFHFPDNQREKVPFVLLPYLLPDLPVILFWGQDPTTEHEALPQLLKFSHRLIFDSESTENLQRFSQCILEQSDTSHTDLVDLNWARIKGWRDAFDEVFDSAARLEQLTLATKVVITYNSSENEFFHHTATQALYLQAWLAAQLGWKVRHLDPGDPVTRIVYFNGVNDTMIEISHQEAADRQPGEILSVDINGSSDNCFSLKLKSGTQQALVHIASNETCELPFSVMISGPRLRYQFLKDLFYGGSSQHYLNTLRTLSQQDWKR